MFAKTVARFQSFKKKKFSWESAEQKLKKLLRKANPFQFAQSQTALLLPSNNASISGSVFCVVLFWGLFVFLLLCKFFVIVSFFFTMNAEKTVGARRVNHQQTTGSVMAARRQMMTHHCRRRATAGH